MKTLLLLTFLSSTGWGYTYKATNNQKIIIRVEDNANIPAISENRDYKAFLESGQVLLPADIVIVDPNIAIKAQAVIDMKNKAKTTDERLDALIKAVGF